MYFSGRQDTMLNVGGAKVRPEEVEEVLFSFAEIADARVYGVRNPITGVVLAADIVARPGQDIANLKTTLPASLRAQLESYKVPRIFNFVSSLTRLGGWQEKEARLI